MSFDANWFPVALRKDIEAGRSVGVRLFDRELCVWRDQRGNIHAWEDRCPHRGMRLSLGFVRGNKVACLYHGWQYDAEGQCRFIPAHPDLEVPPTIRVARYACCERVGMVWVYSDRSVDAPPDLAIGEQDILPVRSLYVDRAPTTVMQVLTSEWRILESNNGVVLSFAADGRAGVAGLQPAGKEKTAVHLVLLGRPATQGRDAQRDTAVWAEELRRLLEEPRFEHVPSSEFEAAR